MPTWNTASDWGGRQSEDRVVHENTSNTDYGDAGVVRQGFPTENAYNQNNYLGYWLLHENSGGTAYDYSGNNEDGNVDGANQGGGATILGTSSYDFDGTDDYIGTSARQSSTNDLSFACLMYSQSTKENQYIMTNSDGDSGDGVEFVYNHNGGQVLHCGWPGTGSFQSESSTPLSTGTWHFVGAQTDYTSVQYYFNGNYESYDITNTNTPNYDLYIGGRPRGLTFDGYLSHCIYYDGLLNQSGFDYLYNTLSTGNIVTGRKTI
jgi:hypothetical protein